ncbi:MAG: hypothetical protein J5760_03770 [Clostridia bacterium]|nr:hypothetical protein [Clostridia bacterium]
MNDNWIMDSNVQLTAEDIFGAVCSFLGCNGSVGSLEQIAARCKPGALDCINAAICEVNRINRAFSGSDISPAAVSSFDTQITSIAAVAYSLLPLKAAIFLAMRYDISTAAFLKKLYDTTMKLYHDAVPAERECITEVY